MKYHRIACKIILDLGQDPFEYPDLITLLKTVKARDLAKGANYEVAAALL